MKTPMDDAKRQAISKSITQKAIDTTTRTITAHFGPEIAADAVGQALLDVCDWYNPAHKSGAAASTYFIACAKQNALNLCKTPTTSDIDEMPNLSNGKLDCNSPELNQLPAWLVRMPIVDKTMEQLRMMRAINDSKTEVSTIKRAERVLELLVAMLEHDDDADDPVLPLGDRNRSDLYAILGNQLGCNPRSVQNAMLIVSKAARRANPELCRAVRSGHAA
jgi:hypothetical protein